MTKITINEMLQSISELTVLELSDLVSAIEEKFNVSATPPMAMPVQVEEVNPVKEEQTEFEVFLNSFGDKKIQVIKEVRTQTGLGLKESKAIVDAVPCSLQEGLSQAAANEYARKLTAVGASVEVK